MQRWKAWGCLAAPLCLATGLGVSTVRASEASEEPYRIDLSEGLDSNMFELFGGVDPGVHNELTSDGLHISIPVEVETVVSAGAASRFTLQGDFAITARYIINRTHAPTGGYGAGATLALNDSTGQALSLQNIVNSEEAHLFVAHWGMKNAEGGLDHDARVFPASGTRGQVRLSRVGTLITYEVKIDGAADFETIHEQEFSSNDIVQVHLAAQTGEWPCDVDVVWQEMEIQADKINSLSDRVQRKPDRAKMYPYVFAVLGVLAVGIAIAVAWSRSRDS